MNYDELLDHIAQILTKNTEDKLQQIVDLLQKNMTHYSWVGIYVVKGNDLKLGPWNGPAATEHTTIPIGKGICGSAAATGKTEIISDVNADNRYLSCFLSTRSEIVVPIKNQERIIGEIDIDSDQTKAFTDKDKHFLEKVADMLNEHI